MRHDVPVAASTGIASLPYPTLDDSPNGSAQIQALAQAVETKLIVPFASAAARDATWPTPPAGALCWVAGAAAPQVYDGRTWQSLFTSTGNKPAPGWNDCNQISDPGFYLIPTGAANGPTGALTSDQGYLAMFVASPTTALQALFTATRQSGYVRWKTGASWGTWRGLAVGTAVGTGTASRIIAARPTVTTDASGNVTIPFGETFLNLPSVACCSGDSASGCYQVSMLASGLTVSQMVLNCRNNLGAVNASVTVRVSYVVVGN